MLGCVGYHLVLQTPPIGAFANYWMTDNSTPTPIAVQGNHYKILGTTTPTSYHPKFTLTGSNAAVYTGAPCWVKITATMSVSDSNGTQVATQLHLDGVDIPGTTSIGTVGSNSRSDVITCIGVTYITTGQAIEAFIANLSNTNAITVKDLAVNIQQVN